MPEDPDESPPPPSPEEATELMTPPTGGASILPASAAPLQEIIGDFEVLGKLGAGGMGAVYRARQISLHREVALKVLPAQFIEDADSVARFQREARVAARLSHANLVRVYSAGQAEGVHYIAMELIEGEDLGRRLKQGGRLPAPEALRICAEVARGLEYAWRHAQLIHRDIKPANIFLAGHGAVKVGDLGLAKSVLGQTTGLTQTGTMMGTPHYISPEQARGDREIDFRADIYSLGCTLYHMLTGQVPYGGSETYTIIHQHINGPLPAILKVWPQCPVPLARLVGRMLKKARHERPASYGELITQIESVWAQIDPQSYAPEAFAPPPAPDPNATLIDQPLTPRSTATILPQSAPPPRKSPLPLYAGIAAALAVLALAAYLLWPKPAEPLTKAQIYARDHAAELAAQAAATPAPVAPKSPAAPPAAEPWQDLLRNPGELRLTSGARVEAGEVRITGWGSVLTRDLRDGAVRMRLKHGDARPQLFVRASDDGAYNLWVLPGGQAVGLDRYLFPTKKSVRLGIFRLPSPPLDGDPYELELRVQGHTLTAKVNGAVVGTATDAAFPEGAFGVKVSLGGPEQTAEIPSLELLDLDAPATSATSPAVATKDAPFVNGLGMKFVPVPITGGPTGGQRVLFSIWETRVQDYEAFAIETKAEGPKPDSGRDATHPAVNVSWEDATAFCAWLTERERKVGRLGANEVYRLPSDHEWSCAVGVGAEEDATKTPMEKNGKIKNVYPWGAVWPPPAGAGNFRGEETKVDPSNPAIPGYRDGFPSSAPVGSFARNALGVFDLGGNAWEWVGDWHNASQATRVVRGGSAMNGVSSSLLSTSRSAQPANFRAHNYGVRVVLAPVP
jgi:serine/threonine protein kinase